MFNYVLGFLFGTINMWIIYNYEESQVNLPEEYKLMTKSDSITGWYDSSKEVLNIEFKAHNIRIKK